jgi:hypothetical protein
MLLVDSALLYYWNIRLIDYGKREKSDINRKGFTSDRAVIFMIYDCIMTLVIAPCFLSVPRVKIFPKHIFHFRLRHLNRFMIQILLENSCFYITYLLS